MSEAALKLRYGKLTVSRTDVYDIIHVTEGRLLCRGSFMALSYDAYSHC